MGYSYSSDSLGSTVPIGYSHFPSSSQVSPPPASRPIAIKKLFSLDDDGFQSSPSPKDWNVPSRSPYETYEFSHSPQTPDELPRSWRSSNFHTRLSSQDMRYGYHHVQPGHQHDDDMDDSDWWEYDERRIRERLESFRRREEEVSLREQELRRREEEVKHKEDEFRPEEKEAKCVEDEIMSKELEIMGQEGENRKEVGAECEEDGTKWKEEFTKKAEEKARRKETQGRRTAEDTRRRETPVTERSEREERRLTQDILLKSKEADRKEDEARLKEEASRAKEEEIRRKEEELARREEELFRREAEANRRYSQQKVQQGEFRKHEEIRKPKGGGKDETGLEVLGLSFTSNNATSPDVCFSIFFIFHRISKFAYQWRSLQ
ncbi:hypothetical protein EDB19DRAFT_534556 [Suillus lakei]|nr:hypothetical protein EDB19DRAFT_534556 [Suillus lakei]